MSRTTTPRKTKRLPYYAVAHEHVPQQYWAMMPTRTKSKLELDGKAPEAMRTIAKLWGSYPRIYSQAWLQPKLAFDPSPERPRNGARGWKPTLSDVHWFANTEKELPPEEYARRLGYETVQDFFYYEQIRCRELFKSFATRLLATKRKEKS